MLARKSWFFAAVLLLAWQTGAVAHSLNNFTAPNTQCSKSSDVDQGKTGYNPATIVHMMNIGNKPVSVIVKDNDGNPAQGIQVTFTCSRGVWQGSGQTTTTRYSDSTGKAAATWGSQYTEGPYQVTYSVSITDPENQQTISLTNQVSNVGHWTCTKDKVDGSITSGEGAFADATYNEDPTPVFVPENGISTQSGHINVTFHWGDANGEDPVEGVCMIMGGADAHLVVHWDPNDPDRYLIASATANAAKTGAWSTGYAQVSWDSVNQYSPLHDPGATTQKTGSGTRA